MSGKRAKLLRRLSDDRREYQALKARKVTPSAMRAVMADPRHAAAIAGARYRQVHAANAATLAVDSGYEALDAGFRLRISRIREERARGAELVRVGLERRGVAIALHEAAHRIAVGAAARSAADQAAKANGEDEASLRAQGLIP